MSQYKKTQRIIAGLILFFFHVQLMEVPLTKAAQDWGQSLSKFSQNFNIQNAKANDPNQIKLRLNLVAILVEDELMNNQTSYDGLSVDPKYGNELKTKSIAERVRRYAIDVQSSQPETKSIIVKIAKSAKVEDIAHMLEKHYLEGDGSKDKITKLAGVVTIGNVPLPVVNKNGYQFMSMMPYADFEDKVYLFDSESNQYLPNPNLKFAKAEVWHGVIKPPLKGEEGNKLLASYFDKNHLYHNGNQDYSVFDKKILFADLFNEFKSMNKMQFNNYLRYLAHWEDLAYLRFNKHLADQLMQEVLGKLKDEKIPTNAKDAIAAAKDTQAQLDKYGIDSVGMADAPCDSDCEKAKAENPKLQQNNNSQEAPSSTNGMPDIQTQPLIMNFLSKYYQLFDKFLGTINDWANYTGRYKASYEDPNGNTLSDIHTIPALIGIKDEDVRAYLKKVNYSLEHAIDERAKALQSNILIPQSAHLSGTITLSNKQGTFDLLPQDFVNFSEQQSDWGATTLYINGMPASSLKSAAECSVYRGSKTDGKNSVLVEATKRTDLNKDNVSDPEEQDPLKKLLKDIVLNGGCLADNYNHPERCFKTQARLPLFNIKGAQELTDPKDIPQQSQTDYRACLEFKEKNLFEKFQDDVKKYLTLYSLFPADQKDAADAMLPNYPPNAPADLIMLFGDKGVFVNLAQVLEKLNIPTNDWRQIGDQFLKTFSPVNPNPFIKEYTLQNPFPGVDSLYIKIETEPAKDKNSSAVYLPTISYHKEPTEDINNTPYTSITEQMKAGGYAQSLPIDNPRYVSFQNFQGGYEKIEYPNVFAAKSYNDFLAALNGPQNLIVDLFGKIDIQKAKDNQQFLTKMIGQEEKTDPNNQDIYSKINAAKLVDALTWRDMDIDQKHKYVFEKYLGAGQDPYVEKMKSGYEAMYFVSRGESDSFQTQFNGDYPEEDKDASFENALVADDTPPTPAPDDENGGKNKKSLLDGIIIFAWFKEIVSWVKETTNKLSATVQMEPICAVKDPAALEDGSNGEYSQTANTSKLIISADKTALKTGSGDTMKLKVIGTDNKDVLQAGDNNTIVDLAISKNNGEIVRIASTHPMQLNAGTATFILQSTDLVGKVTVTAIAKNKNLTSNTLTINSTKGSLRILSYIKNTDTVYANKIANGFIIKDKNDHVIAEVNGITGMITIKDDGYQLLTQTSEANKPVRLSVQQKSGDANILGKVVASVFFKVDGKDAVVIDNANADYLKSFANLDGTHVKDLSEKDDYVVEKATGNYNKNGVYLYVKNGEKKLKIGLIEATGNIYLAGDYSLQMKSPAQSTDPVIFQILSSDKQPRFEVYIGIKDPQVRIVEYAGDYKEYNSINQAAAEYGQVLLEGAFKTNNGSNGAVQSSESIWKKSSTSGILLDSDNDSLTDLQEVLIGTDPQNPDTNGNGVKDGSEINQNQHPIKKSLPLFNDLSMQHEAFADIIRLYKRGIVSGYDDGTFKPDKLLTREEFVKLDLGAICINCTKLDEKVKSSIDAVYNQNPFPDKNFTQNLLYCVKEAKNRSIVSGYKGGAESGYYLPTNSITRAEASKIILETARQQANSKIDFDINIPNGKPWYYNYVLTAQKEHFYPKGRFNELDNLSSEQFKTWLDAQLQAGQSSKFIAWISAGITRAEFAIMVSRLLDKTDCFTDDADKEGLPDNLEKYVYGTNANNPDTDAGGVDDLIEVTNQLNPINPKDDNDSDGDGMPNWFEVKYGLNPFDASDASQDKDNDGLTNLNEFKYATEPTNPDTDAGGKSDGDEVLQKLNPLDATDDSLKSGTKTGSYVVGDNIFENYIYDQQTPAANTSLIDFQDEVPADGKSKLFIRTEILNDNGDIDTSQNGTVKIYRKKGVGDFAKISPEQVKLKKGVAETELTSSIHAGEYILQAELNGLNLPVDDKSIFVTPLDPAKIEIKTASPIIKAGGLSKTAVHILLEDENGNIVNNGTNQITVSASGPGVIAAADEDPTKDGAQISSVSGEFDLDVVSQAEAGKIILNATYDPANSLDITTDTQPANQNQKKIIAQATIDSRDDLHLALKALLPSITSDYKSVTTLEADILDKNNQIVKDFSGTAQFLLLQPELGSLVTENEVKVKDGKAYVNFQAANKAGQATVSVTLNGFDPANAVVTVTPKDTKKIVLEALNKTVEGDPAKPTEILAKLYDTDNNLATNDSTTQVTIRLTNDTKPYGTFDNPTVTAQNGVAKFTLRGTGKTGPLNVIASAASLKENAIKLQAVNTIKAVDLLNINPQVLFASMLGSAFGDVTKENYLAGNLLFAGKTQSVVSLLSNPKPYAGLIQIDYSGRIKTLSNDRLNANVIPGNNQNAPTRIVFTDNISQENLAEVFAVGKPQTTSKALAKEADINNLNEGIYLQNIAETDDYTTAQNGEGVSLIKQGNETIKIYNNGTIKVFDNSFAVKFEPGQNDSNLILQIYDSGIAVAQIIFVYKFGGDVNKLPSDFVYSAQANYAPGVYVHMLNSSKKFELISAFSGNSTALPQGVLIVDTDEEMAKSQAPGFSYSSLEAAIDKPGIGFEGDNKFMLLFTSGNSVGEANVPFASEIGVVLGDPTVRLNNKINVSKTGFTKDLGEEIYFGNDVVQEMQPIDYNSDGKKDLLAAYENGKMRILQNNDGYPKFEDKGVLLDFPNGIVSFGVGDLDKNSQEDIVVASKDSCRKGEICVDAYLNNNGNFVRNHFNLEGFTNTNRISMIRIGDANNDGFADIVTSDDAGTIKVFYNRNGKFDKGSFVGSLGVHIDPKDNLKQELLVAYDNMPKPKANDSTSESNFRDLPVEVNTSQGEIDAANQATADKYFPGQAGEISDTAAALQEILNTNAPGLTTSAPELTTQKQKTFIFADADPYLFASEKRALDLTPPTDNIARGDQVSYAINLVNSGNSILKNLMISDIAPSIMEIEKESIVCNNCIKGETIKISETGQSLRPYIVSGFSLPAKSSITISYKAKIKDTPKVKIYLGQNLSDGYAQDNFMDIGASPDGNNTGRMTYFYSISQNPVNKEINYGTYVSAPPDPKKAAVPAVDPLGVGTPTKELFEDKDDDGIPKVIKKYQEKQTGGPNVDPKESDNDGDGLMNAWDDFNQGLEDADAAVSNAGDAVQAAIAAFTCAGGCIPMPLNFAFLATGSISAMGIPVGFDPGLPVFGWGSPTPWFMWPGAPYQTTLGGRIYLSPTMTMSLGTGICIGPYPVGACWAVTIPPALLGMAKLCESIAGGIEKALASANNAIKSVNDNLTISVGGEPAGDDADSAGRKETGGVKGSATLGSYQYKASVGTNFRLPGFPSFITKWLTDQTSEIINKLTDLPDFYFLYPDPTSIIGAVTPTKDNKQSGNSKQSQSFTLPTFSASSFKDKNGNYTVANAFNPSKILSFMNSIPLIQIDAQEVAIKIPALSAKEIEKFKADAQQWVEDERNEVNRVLALWGCGKKHLDENWTLVTEKDDYVSPYQTACDKLLLEASDLKAAVEKNIAVLQAYQELPRQILAWRNIYKKYLTQIICYIDAIIQFTGGYIKKQEDRIMLWIKMIKQIRELIETWKAILDLIINYQASCDRCSTSRFTLLELILRLFAVIPAPPVIPFPKWPDIYLDLSQIKTGLKILWPDVRFIPERIIMPKIPRLILPDVPTLTLQLPTIPVLPGPPKINLELPDLPPLPLPSLPDIPPPPKVPGLPVQIKIVINIIKNILRILCLIKKGILPVSELMLKAHIEQMTERPLSPLLPIDLGIKLQFPPIKYESLDRIEIAGKLNFQLNFTAIYKFVNGIAEKWNGLTTDFVNIFNKTIKEASEAAQSAADAANNAAKDAVPQGNIDVGADGAKQSGLMQLISSLPSKSSVDADTAKEISEIEALYKELTGSEIPTSNNVANIDQVNALSIPVDQMTQDDLASILKQIEDKDPYLGASIKDLKQASIDLAKASKQYEKSNKEFEKDIHLKATQRYLAKDDVLLNRNLDEVKAGIALQDMPKVEIQTKLMAMRNAMISYSDDHDSENDRINNLQDLESIGRYLAQSRTLKEYLNAGQNGEIRAVAAVGNDMTNLGSASFTTSFNPTKAANDNFKAASDELSTVETFRNFAENARKEFTESTRYLADISGPSQSAGNFTPQVVPKGIYIYNSVDKVNERLIEYTAEVDQPAQMAFIDVDNDGNEDFLYAYGSNIYLKKNYKKQDNPLFYSGDPQTHVLADLMPAAPTVNNFETVVNNNKNVELTWNKATYADVDGYEIAYGLTPDAVNNSSSGKHKLGIILDNAIQKDTNEDLIKVVNKKGSYQINGSLPSEDGLIEVDQPIQTSDNSEIEIIYSSGAKIVVPSNVTYRAPRFDKADMFADNIEGDVYFTGAERSILLSGSNKFKLTNSSLVHAIVESNLNFMVNDQVVSTINMPANSVFQISKNYTEPVSLQVKKGGIEVINPDKVVQHQKLVNGLLIQPNNPIISENGGTANIRFLNGSYLRVNANEDLTLKKLDTPESPDLKVELPNGFYYARIRSFDHLGSLGTASSINLLAPTICADKAEPMPNGGDSERTVPIYKTLKIDASKSFAPQGKIISYYLDLDLNKDDDKDGDPTNDKNFGRDQDTRADSDGDGVTNNDLDDPVFEVGPFNKLGDFEVMLNVIEEALNSAQQKITIHVVVPKITLDQETASQGEVQGSIDMEESNMPIELVRNRGGVITKITSPSANSEGNYLTDDKGKFKVTDLNLKDTVVIKNSQGKIIGEIDPNTGKIILKDNNYHLEVLAAQRPLLPTRIVVIENSTGKVISTLLLIPDTNTDTTIDKADFDYNANTVAIFQGVHVKDTNTFDEFAFEKIPADDANYPGATEIIETTTKKRAAILDSGGNFYALDSRLSLRLKEAKNLDDPLIIQIVFNVGGENQSSSNGQIIGEFFIAVQSKKGLQMLPISKFQSYVDEANNRGPGFDTDKDGMPDQWELIYSLNPKETADAGQDIDNDGLTNLEEFRSGANPFNSDSNGDGISDGDELKYGRTPGKKLTLPYTDIPQNHPYYDDMFKLWIRRIFEGIPGWEEKSFEPDSYITRAEFANIMLKIFCIIPRKEAYEGPSPFSDVPYVQGKLPWYYAIIKEAHYQGFVTGYLGDQTNIPYKPNATITRAEAVKVILEALQAQEVINMGKIPQAPNDKAYYAPYLQIAQDLTPYLKKAGSVKKPFIITAEEAARPEDPVTRAGFLAMADRVLTTSDCSVIDDDNDGMPSYWERLNGLNPYDSSDAPKDPDRDSLTNLEEFKHGTDPRNPDTDAGGMKDGEEVKKNGTFPLDPADDNSQNVLAAPNNLPDPRSDLTEGFYIIKEECLSCPCVSAIDHTADLIVGDRVFGIISDHNKNKPTIFSKSNEIEITEIPHPDAPTSHVVIEGGNISN